MKLEGLDHIAITVRDPLSAMVWYEEVLGLQRRFEEAWGDYPIVMLAGESGVALFPAASADPGTVPDKGNTLTMRHFPSGSTAKTSRERRNECGGRAWRSGGRTTASRTPSTSATRTGTR